MKDLKVLYAEWRKELEEIISEPVIDIPANVDCGEAAVREDFSAYAELNRVISFEEMFKLEQEFEKSYTEEIKVNKETKTKKIDGIEFRDKYAAAMEEFVQYHAEGSLSNIINLRNKFGEKALEEWDRCIDEKGYMTEEEMNDIISWEVDCQNERILDMEEENAEMEKRYKQQQEEMTYCKPWEAK